MTGSKITLFFENDKILFKVSANNIRDRTPTYKKTNSQKID